MEKRRPPAPRLPTMCKPMKTKVTDQVKANDHRQQNPPLEPEMVVAPPD